MGRQTKAQRLMAEIQAQAHSYILKGERGFSIAGFSEPVCERTLKAIEKEIAEMRRVIASLAQRENTRASGPVFMTEEKFEMENASLDVVQLTVDRERRGWEAVKETVIEETVVEETTEEIGKVEPTMKVTLTVDQIEKLRYSFCTINGIEVSFKFFIEQLKDMAGDEFERVLKELFDNPVDVGFLKSLNRFAIVNSKDYRNCKNCRYNTCAGDMYPCNECEYNRGDDMWEAGE